MTKKTISQYGNQVDTSNWSEHARQLWRRICAHSFEDSDIALDFCARLAREQHWSPAQTREAIEEYRRFCFLAALGEGQMTPSVAVDQVWHLHLQYTRDYWQHFCPITLGTPLHHGPTRGGAAEGHRFREQYANTLATYERWFGMPPQTWWPDERARFRNPENYRWVDASRYWQIPKPNLPLLPRISFALFVCLLAIPANVWALPINPLDWPAKPFLKLYFWTMVCAILFAAIRHRAARHTGPALGTAQTFLEIGYLAGGPQRAMDAAIAELFSRDALLIDPSSKRLRSGPHTQLDSSLEPLLNRIRVDGDIDQLFKHTDSIMAPVKKELIRKRLWRSDGTTKSLLLTTTAPFVTLLLFGAIRIYVATLRDKPYDYLAILMLATLGLLIANWRISSRNRRTLSGEHALITLKRRYARTLLAARNEELALAVALSGTAALALTPFGEYHQIRHPPSQSSGDSGGGGGGDGDGGSGCGGCGGCGD